MAPSEFFYLDSLPINPNKVTSNLSLADELVYRGEFNLAINSTQVESRLADLQAGIKEVLNKTASAQVSVNDLNLILESFLCSLYSASSILSLDHSTQTSHYERRKAVVINSFLTIDESYLDTLLFSSAKTWGTSYGSLGYFLHTGQVTEAYLHPSQLICQAVEQLANQASVGVFGSNLNDLVRFSLSDSISDDVSLYRIPVEALSASPEIKASIVLLSFLEDWLPQVISWHLEPYRVSGAVLSSQQLSGAELQAFNLLYAVAQACLNYSLDDSSFSNLTYRFIHQDIDPAFFSLIDDLIMIRRSYELDSSSLPGDLEKLASPLLDQINGNLKLGVLKQASYQVLQDFCPPGGYNLLLLATASALLNRAFILTDPSNTSFTDLSVFPLGFASPFALEFVGRILRLIFLAGYTLMKSNIEGLNTIGTNLITLSNFSDSSIQVDVTQ